MPLLDDEDLRGLFRTEPRRQPFPEVGRVSFADLGGTEEPSFVEAYTDGGCRGNPGPAGFGAVIRYEGQTIELLGTVPRATNNESEYEGLLLALRWAVEHKVRRLHVRMDSELVIRQMQGRYGVSWVLKPVLSDGLRARPRHRPRPIRACAAGAEYARGPSRDPRDGPSGLSPAEALRMDKPADIVFLNPHDVVHLSLPELRQRLTVAKSELESLAPAPRVELDRESLLALVSLSLQALAARPH